MLWRSQAFIQQQLISPQGVNAWWERKKVCPAAEHSTVQQEESKKPDDFRAPMRSNFEPEPLATETPLHMQGQIFLLLLKIFNFQPIAASQ